jgi:hypothetical protein
MSRDMGRLPVGSFLWVAVKRSAALVRTPPRAPRRKLPIKTQQHGGFVWRQLSLGRG